MADVEKAMGETHSSVAVQPHSQPHLGLGDVNEYDDDEDDDDAKQTSQNREVAPPGYSNNSVYPLELTEMGCSSLGMGGGVSVQ